MHSSTIRLSRFAYLGNFVAMGIIAAGALWLVTQLIADGNYPMATMVSAIIIFLCLVYLRPRFTPMRWLAVGIALAMLFTLYPIFYTFYIAFTNMGDGHLLSKQQAIERLEGERTLPEGGVTYSWAAYQSPEGDFALWLIADDGTAYLAKPGEPVTAVSPDDFALDEDGFPQQVEGYRRLTNRETVPIISELGAIDFGTEDDTVRIRSLRDAATLVPHYRYDAEQDVMVDQQTGTVYTPVDGTFTAESGETLTPGYMVTVGWRNFVRFLNNEAIRGPIVGILLWNFSFAFLSVVLSSIVGLIIALLFEELPGKKVIRALLIIPYPIPVLVSVLIWRSILNPDLGIVSITLESLFGAAPAWFLNPSWARIALVLINVWLSYPYFYVITAGALSAISSEIKQAAIVDGASGWQSFYHIMLPLLLRILSPLLIASFTFNFNNFNLIYIFNFGGPPLANTIIPVGHTDILISFVYKLAFVTSSTTNYGLAAAISIVLFIFVGLITILQTRFTSAFKEA
ncbi:MAG: ABC transporter permease subunit [Chloroflexi bacterium]|nr:ABC transporter permease subunit [Chloroflexota bacterium]MCI0648774.1 ABC transporter permease subunit [Chloroflexota bacterium]MCI0727242.1 ABC transporter permease subunit [Chloroflexota bacterium]